MRLPVNQPSSLGPIALAAAFGLAAVAAGALAAPLLAREPVPFVAPTGPAADYPMVLGTPFAVDGVTYTPADTMNYDQVGYAGIDDAAGSGVSLSHRTLPLPSYVEVTSLVTGRTILVRAERRGPMTGRDLVALSPAAAAQLGASGRTPVRVRRVNPPEVERALLRTGQTAPARMDTPMSLVSVLLRKLDPALAPPVAPIAAPAENLPVVAPAPAPSKSPNPANKAPVAKAAAEAKPAKPPKAAPAPTLAPPPPPPPQPRIAATKGPATPPKVAPAPTLPAKPPAVATAKPAIPAKSATKPTAAPASAPRGGRIYVQVGAFSTRARAETAARQVGGTIAPAGKLFRVQVAGFGTAAEAAGALAKARGAGYSDARIQRAD